MIKVEVRYEDGSFEEWSGKDPEDACRRAADCKQKTVVAWRWPRVGIYVGPPEGA